MIWKCPAQFRWVSYASAIVAHQCPFLLRLILPTVMPVVYLSRLLAFPVAPLSRAAPLVLFGVLNFRLFAASLCLSTHRSDRRHLQPLPQLLQRPRAHESAESSSHRHMQRRDSSVQGSCWAFEVTFCHLCCHHPLECCDLDRILDVLVVSCLVFCHTEFPVHDESRQFFMPAMEAPSTADFGRYHLFSSCHAQRPASGNTPTLDEQVCQLRDSRCRDRWEPNF